MTNKTKIIDCIIEQEDSNDIFINANNNLLPIFKKDIDEEHSLSLDKSSDDKFEDEEPDYFLDVRLPRNCEIKCNRIHDKFYNIVDEFDVIENVLHEYNLGNGEKIILPIGRFGRNRAEYEYLGYCLNHPIIKPYGIDLIKKHPEAKIIITDSIEAAESYNFMYSNKNRDKEPEYIFISFYAGIHSVNNIDFSAIRNKNIYYIINVLPINDTFKEACMIGNTVYKNLKKAGANIINFICMGKNRETNYYEFIELSSYQEFQNYVKKYGVELQLNFSDPISMIDNAVLKSSEEIEDRPIVIEGFAKLGKVYVAGGGAKTGKSLATARLALSISHGNNIWGLKANKNKVLYLDTEMDDDDYKDRGIADQQHEGFKVILASDLELPKEKDMADDMTRLTFMLESIRNYALEKDFKVVIIDCMYRLLNESSANEVKEFVNKLKLMKRDGFLVIVVHHFNKSEIDPIDPFKNLAGHSNFYRAIDGGILLLPEQGENELDDGGPKFITMKFVARSFKQIPDKQLVFVNGEHILVSEYEEQMQQNGLSIQKGQSSIAKLKRFIKENVPTNQDDAISSQELAELMGNSQYVEGSTSNIRKRKLNDWFKAGYLNRTGLNPYKYYQGKNL